MLLYVYGNHYFSFSEPRCVSNYFISVFVHFVSDSRKLYPKKKFGKLLIVIIILSLSSFRFGINKNSHTHTFLVLRLVDSARNTEVRHYRRRTQRKVEVDQSR